MRKESTSLFVCLGCRGREWSTHGAEDAAGRLLEGQLECRTCGRSVAVRGGVPRFVAGEGYASSFGFQWNKFRRTQLDSHTGLPLSKRRLFEASGWPRTLHGERVMEAGCGAGRFTEVLVATGATVVSFDLSEAVDANFANNGDAASLTVLQASIFDIPLREGSFDKVVCLGVLQHTPDPERAFATLVRFLKPGGEIVVDVYARRLRALVSWKYLLRPLTTRIAKERLFRGVQRAVRVFHRPAALLRRSFGRAGPRLLPILDYSHLGLSPELAAEWAVLDTFDMYSPAHDHPRSRAEVRAWFMNAGLQDVTVEYGPNGVVAKGRRPAGG